MTGREMDLGVWVVHIPEKWLCNAPQPNQCCLFLSVFYACSLRRFRLAGVPLQIHGSSLTPPELGPLRLVGTSPPLSVLPDSWVGGRVDSRGNGTPLQCSCLENPMDGGAWWAAIYGVAQSRTPLSGFTFTFHFHALESEIATHSSVLAWRIPGTGEPGGLLSMGLHRVGHDWSDLAAAVADKNWEG